MMALFLRMTLGVGKPLDIVSVVHSVLRQTPEALTKSIEPCYFRLAIDSDGAVLREQDELNADELLAILCRLPSPPGASVQRIRRRPNHPCLVVYHIPKAGGGSLHKWFVNNGLRLWTNYDTRTETMSDYVASAGDRDPSVVKFDEADVYMGHWAAFGAARFREIFPRHCKHWTILRDPIQRAWSQLRFTITMHYKEACCTSQTYAWAKRCLACAKTGCKGCPWPHEYQNSTCRMLSAPGHWDMYNKAYAQDWQNSCNLSQALQHLTLLDGVGFLENMESTLQSWTALFKLPPCIGPCALPKHRSQPTYYNNLPEIEAGLGELNIGDMQLVVAARGLYGAHKHNKTELM